MVSASILDFVRDVNHVALEGAVHWPCAVILRRAFSEWVRQRKRPRHEDSVSTICFAPPLSPTTTLVFRWICELSRIGKSAPGRGEDRRGRGP